MTGVIGSAGNDRKGYIGGRVGNLAVSFKTHFSNPGLEKALRLCWGAMMFWMSK
jgi:hypothetical protein